jgi:hypothetical protein
MARVQHAAQTRSQHRNELTPELTPNFMEQSIFCFSGRANHCEPTKVCNHAGSWLAPPGLALDPPERQRRWSGYWLLMVLLWLAILCLPWLLARLGGAEREAGSPVSNPMGWI